MDYCAPQGGLLTVLLFDMQVNYGGSPCQPLLAPGVEGPEHDRIHCFTSIQHSARQDHEDDLTLIEAVPLATVLGQTV